MIRSETVVRCVTFSFPSLLNFSSHRFRGGGEVLCRQGDECSRKNRAARVKQTPISLKNSSVFDWFIYMKSLGGIINPQRPHQSAVSHDYEC